MSDVFVIRTEIVSEANRRDHWAAKARRVKNQKRMAWEACVKRFGRIPTGNRQRNCRITLTRIKGKGQRDFDGDNLQSGFKAIRDGIAKYLGVDDGSDRLEWIYQQEKGDGGKGMVRVEIADREGGEKNAIHR